MRLSEPVLKAESKPDKRKKRKSKKSTVMNKSDTLKRINELNEQELEKLRISLFNIANKRLGQERGKLNYERMRGLLIVIIIYYSTH